MNFKLLNRVFEKAKKIRDMERKIQFGSWVKEVTSDEWRLNSVNHNRPDWNKRMSVKKGDIGERIFKGILEKHGWIVYKCITHDTPHVVDLVAYKNKRIIRFFEVKTKKYMKNPDRTGINTINLETYKYFLTAHNQDIFLVFVDEALEKIYGNFLSKLLEPKAESGWLFPNEFTAKDGTSITTFPLSSMINIDTLSREQIKEILKFTKKQ